MKTTPPLDLCYGHVRAHYSARLRAPGERFREAFAETLTDWRLGPASAPVKLSEATAILHEGIGEIARLRLMLAYAPILKTLQRMEDQLAIFVAIRDDPYAPPPKRRGSR